MTNTASANDAKAGLIRPEAVEGKAYARLAHPLLIANPSLLRPLTITLFTATLLVAGLALLPLTNSHRGYGVVSAGISSTVVRSAKAGQIVRIVSQGERVTATGAISFIEQPLQTEGGRNPSDGYTARLRKLAGDRDADLKLLNERFALSMSLAAQVERSLIEQISSLEASVQNQSRLVKEAEALTARISGVAAYVTRLDTLALAERTVGAQNRLLDLHSQVKKLKTDLIEKARSKRVLEIDQVREEDKIQRQFQFEEAALLEKAASQNFIIPSPIDGEVLTVYKKRGDWVTAGDEIALVGDRAVSKSKTLSIQIPSELANLLLEKQLVRVWPNGTRRSDPPLVGTVHGIEQRTPEGYRVSGQQPGSAAGSFVAHVALDQVQQSDYGDGIPELRAGSEVEMEIIFGTKRLYETLLPRRLTKTWDQSNSLRK
jgi:biotin carboxyl carrier protein